MNINIRKTLSFGGAAVLFFASQFTFLSAPVRAEGTRNILQQPFAQDSIWNLPIHNDAVYVPATIPAPINGAAFDVEHFIIERPEYPERDLILNATWGRSVNNRVTGSTVHSKVRIPDDLTIWDEGRTPNSTTAILRLDGSLLHLNPTTRPAKGSRGWPNLYAGWLTGNDETSNNLYASGISGSHGGSALSSLGGSIRRGELTGSAPIRHAMHLNIWGKYMHFDRTTNMGWRWPATTDDAYAQDNYAGTNPAVKLGALVALKPEATPESMGITSAYGKKIFQAFKDYGAYLVDDSGWDFAALGVDYEEQQSITWGSAESSDLSKMVAALHVVDNNAAETPGGGIYDGTALARRAPLADPIAPDETAPTVAFTAPVLGSTVAGTVALNVNATDDGPVAKVEFYDQAGVLVCTDATVRFDGCTWNSGSAPLGYNTISAKAYDHAGHVTTTTTTVNVVRRLR